MRYVLLVQYDGTCFSGFQKQKSARTVQGTLEEAASGLGACRVCGSGRTDAGVHALGQVCHFDADPAVPPEHIRDYLNAKLPPDVRVLKSAAAPDGFDCTRGARKKTYLYRFYHAETPLPLLARYAVRVQVKPDVARMRAAAELLLGEHDFAAFRASGSSAKTTVRTIYAIGIEERERRGYTEYELRITGNGFLYNMVRILAGELIAIGGGRTEARLAEALRTGKRELLSKTMPANGLVLLEVDYGIPLFAAE